MSELKQTKFLTWHNCPSADWFRLENYQDMYRFYLDEYSGQDALRTDFFAEVNEERKSNPFYHFQYRFNRRN